MNKLKIGTWSQIPDRQPMGAIAEGVDLVIVRWDDQVSVLYGRCRHRGALMSDGYIAGNDIICGLHQWDYRLDTGVSAYNNSEYLDKFQAWVEEDGVYVDAAEIIAWREKHPQPYNRDAYQGEYADIHGTIEEPATHFIHQLAANGLTKNWTSRASLCHGCSWIRTAAMGQSAICHGSISPVTAVGRNARRHRASHWTRCQTAADISVTHFRFGYELWCPF